MERTKHACNSCHKKKKKCNTPDIGYTCERCMNTGIQCEYYSHKKRGRPKKDTTNIGLGIETSNSNNFLESNENCSGTIHPGSYSQTNNILQLNDLVNNFSFTNSSLQSNDFSFTNGSTQVNNFSFVNSFPHDYRDSKN
ncbi:4671_t:CDS:2 [Diversispora eburnea]|uniref:4671_t:CDS:1 n=1 Tax=Diversispora eburnea TaxID=1213867 RepID=A0A9N8YPM5_9GLOM|nr:4671_t:CDS:2 [Diversispora eburnea]